MKMVNKKITQPKFLIKPAKKSNTGIKIYLLIGRTNEYKSLPKLTIFSISGACVFNI